MQPTVFIMFNGLDVWIKSLNYIDVNQGCFCEFKATMFNLSISDQKKNQMMEGGEKTFKKKKH